MKPIVLVAVTSRWFPMARLAMALARAGFTVKAVCPSGHPLSKIGAAKDIYAYRGLAPIDAFANSIAAAKPDFIIPGDDLATRHLHSIHSSECTSKAGSGVCGLIERSLGSPEGFPVVAERSKTIELAREAGVRVPKTEVIANLEGLRGWIAETGLPAVLKADGSSGGDGVRIVRTRKEAEYAFRSLSLPPLWMRAMKRALVNRDTTLVWPSILRRRPTVNVQHFVPGREATSTVVCWKGRVLAALHCEVLKKTEPLGPATVLRFIEDNEMLAATQKIALRLKLSGVHGFDFIREDQTGKIYLIEMNPRATQVGHLTLGPGRDLPAALYATLTGEDVRLAPIVTDKDTVALFPQEWLRDSSSPYLRSAYHDVPWEEAELVRAGIRSRRPGITRYAANQEYRAFLEIACPAGGPQ